MKRFSLHLLAPCATLLAGFSTAQDTYATFNDTTWAGPVQVRENGTAKFNLVEATLIMPQLSIPKNPRTQADEYTAAFWIGFDGYLTSADTGSISGLWQAGVIMSIWQNGTTEYSGFYEWVPEDPVQVTTSQLAISEGDHVHVTLTNSNDGLVGNVTFKNLNTSQVYSFGMEAPTTWRGPTWPSAGNSAEWIIEAGTYLNGPQYIFPDWGNAYFENAIACRSDGQCVLPGGNNTVITSVLWEDTQTLYTKTYIEGDRVRIEYVEEQLDG